MNQINQGFLKMQQYRLGADKDIKKSLWQVKEKDII